MFQVGDTVLALRSKAPFVTIGDVGVVTQKSTLFSDSYLVEFKVSTVEIAGSYLKLALAGV